MRFFASQTYLLLMLWLIVAGKSIAAESDPLAEAQFDRDVRPILAAHCWHCHGPDAAARKADLRLDQHEAAHADRGGYRVIDAEDPQASELLNRISSSDPGLQMPPPDQPRQLSPEMVKTLTRWVHAGGEWAPHWSFIPPKAEPPPKLSPKFSRHDPFNVVDRFVLAKLDEKGLSPAPPAPRETLIRRLTLDLTGLPPTPDEVDAFLNDRRADAWERLVDRLLASPRYGERMAQVWLDAARFADSGGYQGDILRSMWLWRDWVIDAYNANVPFDQFTIEQLAGDLLPSPSEEQLIATGFNRNHRINDEDGIVLEEFRVEYVADRVETTATVWLGLTARCARCHDHKYDPITQREHYGLFAFFNSIDEKGRGHGNAPPLLTVVPPELQRRLDALDQRNGAVAEDEAARLQQEREKLLAAAPTVMIMREREAPRPTRVLIRGAYDRPGEQVSAGTPQAIAPSFDGFARNRLGLARWLVDPRNPLTARVAVNRYWQTRFGRGLVETSEDFGTQGSLPTHPRLLDWLAAEFVRTGWDVKAMQRLLVSSATYRQSSSVAEADWRRDSDNRWLSRGPRFRLSGETIRDQALAAGGLLVERLGGPSVRPYQPEGLWNELASASRKYEQSHGADLYRRSLYSFVRRTVPLPSMTTLDAPNRETCVVRRPRTNTPLQALVLMNDETFVEAARALAERCLQEQETDRDRLIAAFRRLLVRRPKQRELKLLTETLCHYRKEYSSRRADAESLIAVGESKPDESLDAVELASLTAVCSLLMNLDETLNRE